MELLFLGITIGVVIMLYIMDKNKHEVERQHRKEMRAKDEWATSKKNIIKAELVELYKSKLIMNDTNFGGLTFSYSETLITLSDKYGWDAYSIERVINEIWEEDWQNNDILERYQNYYFIKCLYEDIKWRDYVERKSLRMPDTERLLYLRMVKNGEKPNF
ncbi:MAG: hypothetical protein ACKVU0_16760 [Saprospiraceae bacterium]